MRLDLEDFFASVPAARVFGIFRTAGYPEAVAHVLTALCVTVVPATEWARIPRPSDPRHVQRHARLGRRLATPHLPQGAPTSPALASLAALGLDRRLAALAPPLLAGYSRYADDLTFSGGADLPAGTLARVVAEVARDEGFRVAPGKTGVRRHNERQLVCGVVVNERLNVPRPSTTVSRRSCTTRRATARRPPTATTCPTSARTCLGASPGWASCTRRAASGCGRASTRSPGERQLRRWPAAAAGGRRPRDGRAAGTLRAGSATGDGIDVDRGALAQPVADVGVDGAGTAPPVARPAGKQRVLLRM